MHLWGMIPDAWRRALSRYAADGDFRDLERFLSVEVTNEAVFPPLERWFAALEMTPPEAVKVVILGQDPYHDENQAHGLAFSVPPQVALPPSLRNIYKEMSQDLGVPAPRTGNLEGWARQGVLLLNTVLSVRAHEPGSHQKRGWEPLTDMIIKIASAQPRPVAFWLWGNFARAKVELIDARRHFICESVHPSPLSASRGFFGSRPFSRTDAWLKERGIAPVDWCALDSDEAQPELF